MLLANWKRINSSEKCLLQGKWRCCHQSCRLKRGKSVQKWKHCGCAFYIQLLENFSATRFTNYSYMHKRAFHILGYVSPNLCAGLHCVLFGHLTYIIEFLAESELRGHSTQLCKRSKEKTDIIFCNICTSSSLFVAVTWPMSVVCWLFFIVWLHVCNLLLNAN